MKWPQRFWAKTQAGEDGCLNWTASLDHYGYGQVKLPPPRSMAKAHRVAFELAYGRPPSMALDHKCRNRRCVNPEHLREASPKENALNSEWALKTRCPQGHPYDARNTYRADGARWCRTCHRDRERVARVEKRERYKELRRKWWSSHRDEINARRRACRTAPALVLGGEQP